MFGTRTTTIKLPKAHELHKERIIETLVLLGAVLQDLNSKQIFLGRNQPIDNKIQKDIHARILRVMKELALITQEVKTAGPQK